MFILVDYSTDLQILLAKEIDEKTAQERYNWACCTFLQENYNPPKISKMESGTVLSLDLDRPEIQLIILNDSLV